MYTYVFSRSVFPDFYHCVIRISCSDKTRSEGKSYFRPTVPKKKTQQQLFGLFSDLGRSLNNTELNISSQKVRIIFSLDHARVPSLYFIPVQASVQLHLHLQLMSSRGRKSCNLSSPLHAMHLIVKYKLVECELMKVNCSCWKYFIFIIPLLLLFSFTLFPHVSHSQLHSINPF